MLPKRCQLIKILALSQVVTWESLVLVLLPLIKPQKSKSIRATTEMDFSYFYVPQNVPKKMRKFFLVF